MDFRGFRMGSIATPPPETLRLGSWDRGAVRIESIIRQQQ